MPYRHFPFMTSRNQPFEWILFGSAILTGASIFTNAPPQPLEKSMPEWFLKFWYICLLLGGIIGFISLIPKRKTRRQFGIVLNIERGSLLIISAAVLAYVAAIFVTVRPPTAGVIFIGAWLAIIIVRIYQIQKSLSVLIEEDNKPAVEELE